ncbi:MAG TPA: hypothetical protein VGG07_02095 [Solirubrobacteraceae bacterium]|jgi:hypothetical protein
MAGPVAAANAFTDPPANRDLSEATLRACQAGPTSAACQTTALADINAARAAEGLGPMQLPGDFGSLTVPQQLLVLSNLERVDRGLVPVLGLSGPLDQNALTGAQDDADPVPTPFNGNSASSNWEGGYGSPFEADFVWMYDDGFGSNNIDCTSPSDMGCWGHRHDILEPFEAPVVMGAANAQGQFGASQTELFVGGDAQTAPGQADAPLAPTWATIAATLPFTVSPAALHFTATQSSAPLAVAASGENMDIAAVLPAGAGGWSVTPATCAVTAGSSCTFTVSAGPAAAGSAPTLTLQGPNGAQQVALSKPGAATLQTTSPSGATLRTGSAARTIVAGSATTIAGVLRRSAGTGTGTGAGVGAAGLVVALTGQAAGAPKATTVAHATTTATGAVSFHVRPQVNTTYHLVFAGTPALSAASGAPVRIDVAPRITAALAHRSLPAGTAVKLSGTVTPAPGSDRLALQVKRGRRWVTIAHTRARRAGRYRFTIRPRRGASRYRVMLPATSRHARGLSAGRALRAT